jgi:hypothetical protein
MTDENQKPRTLSREDLYELVWSKPIRELAKDFRISDVALAKRCRGLGIPLPGRGYWARVGAGQRPYRPKLPEPLGEPRDQQVLRVPFASSRGIVRSQIPSDEDAADEVWLAERIACEQTPVNAISVDPTPSHWDPVVRVHRDKLRAEVKEVLASKAAWERYQKWPESRKRRESSGDSWKWQRMLIRGERLLDYHKPRPFRVTMATLERALAITNTIAAAGKSRGFVLRDDEREGRITVVGHSAEFQVRVVELLESKLRNSELREGDTEKYKVPTGRLRIVVMDGWQEGPVFEDTERIKVEALLNRFFVALYKLTVKQWREARVKRRREEQEELAASRRAEAAKIRAEEERKAAAERQRREALLVEAKRWEEARRIQSYVAWLRQAAADERCSVAGGEFTVEREGRDPWVTWALAVADELDPTAGRLARLETDEALEAE